MQHLLRAALWLAPLVAGGVALVLGQDANWDLRNYHYYDPHAWLSGRLGFDIAVAHAATFYNPTMHLPFYWAVGHLEPWMVGALLGALAGGNLWCLVAIARRLDAAPGHEARPAVVLALAVAGMCGAMFVSELGTSFGDNILSLLVLSAIACALRDLARLRDGPHRASLVAWPALLCGAAAGLKLPFAIYGVALVAALLLVPRTWRGRGEVLLAGGVAGLAGAASTGGWWALEMARRYGNPVFPYFNEWFASPWAGAASYRDPRFLPGSLADALLFPFYFALAPRRVAEVDFVDPRFGLLYLALGALLAASIVRAARASPAAAREPTGAVAEAGGAGGSEPLAERFLLAFVIVAFVAWMTIFGVARYLVVGELLAPLAIWSALRRLLPGRPPGAALAIGLLAILLLAGRPAAWDRRPWSADYFDVLPPRIDVPDRALVLMAGYEPSAYMIPFMPPATRVLRIEGYFTGPSPRRNATDRLMAGIVASHDGPILMLFRSYERPRAESAAAAYGLGLADPGCRELLPGIEPDRRHPFLLCGTVRPRP